MRRRVDAVLDGRLGHRPTVGKLVRYSSASIAGTVTSQVTLLVCFAVIGIAATTSNVIAVFVGAIPNYLINRTWTWNKRDPHSLTREVLPFWLMTLAGLLLSTWLVALADQRFDGNPAAVNLANVAGFGLLWVLKFLILDRILFKVVELAEEVTHH